MYVGATLDCAQESLPEAISGIKPRSAVSTTSTLPAVLRFRPEDFSFKSVFYYVASVMKTLIIKIFLKILQIKPFLNLSFCFSFLPQLPTLLVFGPYWQCSGLFVQGLGRVRNLGGLGDHMGYWG